jgi:hypothetical protein
MDFLTLVAVTSEATCRHLKYVVTFRWLSVVAREAFTLSNGWGEMGISESPGRNASLAVMRDNTSTVTRKSESLPKSPERRKYQSPTTPPSARNSDRVPHLTFGGYSHHKDRHPKFCTISPLPRPLYSASWSPVAGNPVAHFAMFSDESYVTFARAISLPGCRKKGSGLTMGAEKNVVPGL